MAKVTLEINGPVTPERLIADLRKHAPHLISEEEHVPPVPVRPDPRQGAAEAERLLTPAEVAAMFRVHPKTVTRWAQVGKLTCIRTLGGHRRYRETEVKELRRGKPTCP